MNQRIAKIVIRIIKKRNRIQTRVRKNRIRKKKDFIRRNEEKEWNSKIEAERGIRIKNKVRNGNSKRNWSSN